MMVLELFVVISFKLMKEQVRSQFKQLSFGKTMVFIRNLFQMTNGNGSKEIKWKPAAIKDAVTIALFASATLLFFGPAFFYYNNVVEFTFLFREVFLPLVIFTTVATLIISSFLMIVSFSRRIYTLTFSVLFIVGILLWLQGNVLVWDYGIFNGSSISWEDKKSYGYIDVGLWSFLLLIALVLPSVMRRIAPFVAKLLLIVQVASLIIIASQANPTAAARFRLDETEKFSFSKEKNVIILILDSFSTEIFENLLKHRPELANMFDGFTFFKDSVGGYSSTFASIPLILTGQYYANEVPFQEFVKESFLSSSSLPLTLKANGFNVFMPQRVYFYSHPRVTSSSKEKTAFLSFAFKDAVPLLDNTIFRHAPHQGKQVIFDKTLKKPYVLQGISDRIAGKQPGEKQNPDIEYLKNMLTKSNANLEMNGFKLHHLLGVHEPYTLNENLEIEIIDLSPAGVLKPAAATMNITRQFLNKLKELNVYDNSMILLLGDHGNGSPEWIPEIAGDDMSYLAPLIMIKPFMAKGKMRTSHSPVSLSDVPRTVLDELSLSNQAPGYSMLVPEIPQSRERKYLAYDYNEWANDGLLSKRFFFPTMKEFMVKGKSRYEDSWHLTSTAYKAAEIVKNANHYRYGNTIFFGNKGNSNPYWKHGWAHSHKFGDRSFSIGKRSSLSLLIEPSLTDLVLTADLLPITVRGMYAKHRVVIWVNGNREGEWTVKSDSIHRIIIPKEHLGRTLDLTFEFLDAKSPHELNFYKDHRPQSVVFRSITLNTL